MKITKALLAGALLLGSSFAASAEGGAAADFYKNETVRLIVGTGPGGGFDQYARLLAPELGKVTGATVVVENRPGGGGITAINQVAGADPDGLSVMLINGVPAALGQITEAPAVRFELQNLPFVGRVAAEPWVLLVSKNSGYTSLKDLVEASKAGKTLSFSGLGRVDGPTDTAAVVCEALELSCNLVVGFKGSSEASLAAIRGDVTGIAITDRSARDYSQDGSLIPVAVIGHNRSQLLPDVPTIFEAVDVPQEGAFWIDFRAGIVDIGRALITTPGTPDERISYLREAFETILADPAFVKSAEDRGLPIDYASGEDVQDTVGKIFGNLPEDQLSAVRDVLLSKYF
ncbi:putative extra-cytoplasmic solute receptors (bug family) [Aurantimonas manganoxydans SI85-9A1]|uniref:Putative extra-cytoplasmic solute receptors (Bug family) n=1 Tax=Aurantimonas manganoxydans (strain ATCC BAA-1229 / DSM 21871 / SI85-9A1) TaxID=287752 RepID=Q1YKY2_AURMS|nr:tripartite tricarboxylate transporter substrate binding protein [Aurantimonas manganoxydans]EAS50391.1 putative extra-cytoplasmic solute receptors (bug family) [Aurantimonas manganoxydans SI85-9A1]